MQGLVKEIQSAILSITSDSEEGRKILEGLNLDYFEIRKDSDYDEFRKFYEKTAAYEPPEIYEKDN